MVTTPGRLADIIAERLAKLASNPAAKQRLVSASGVPASSLNRMLLGDNEPKTSNLKRIAEAAGVSLDWLTGLTDDQDGTASGFPVHLPTGPGASVPEGFVAVPALDVRASAGMGTIPMPLDPESADIVAFRMSWLRSVGLIPGRVHILWASGDSMQPTIRNGDMLLVDRTIDRVVDDGIYVVVASGTVRVKRISLRLNGAVVLRSDNQHYEAETIPADEVPQIIVEGRVRWVGGPI